MPNLTLYELVDEYRQALAQLSELDLPEEVIRDTVEGLNWPVEQKAKNCIAFAGNLEAESEMIDQRVKVLQARSRALANRSAWLKSYVLGAMQASGITEIRCADFVAKPRANPERVVIDNTAGLPATCFRVVPATFEPDKTAIKEALKAEDPQVSQCAHLERSFRLDVR